VLCRVYVYYQGVRRLLLVGITRQKEIGLHIMSSLKGIVKFSGKLDWPGSLDAPRSLSKEHRGAPSDVNSNPLVPYQEHEFVQVGV
jgi:hypothetical protein